MKNFIPCIIPLTGPDWCQQNHTDHSKQVIAPPDGKKRVKITLFYGPLTQATDTGFLHLWVESKGKVECEKSHCLNAYCHGVRAATLWEADLTFSGIILNNI